MTYSVRWVHVHNRWATRWDHILAMDSYEHETNWSSLINTILLLLLLGFLVAVILLRAVWMRVPKGTSRFSVAAPVAVIMGIQLATLLQFIYVASPILPEVTVFDGGADAMVAN